MKATAINMNQFLPLKDDYLLYSKNPSITGVFYDFENKVAAASDGCILCVSAEAYNPKYEKEKTRGISIGKDGRDIHEGVYPNYAKCMPKVNEDWICIKLDKKKIRKAIREAKAFALKEDVWENQIQVSLCGMCYSAKYLKKVMRVVDEVYVNPNERYPSQLYGRKGGTEIMLMPFVERSYTMETMVIVKRDDAIVWRSKKENDAA